MMALWSIETHSITMKNMALFRPKLSNFFRTNQIARFVKCDRIFDSIEELKTRGGARNFPTEGLELPTGGLK